MGELGYVQLGVPVFYRQPARLHTIATEFSIDTVEKLPVVDIQYGYGGSSRDGIDRGAAAGIQGIVFAGTGNGSLSDSIKAGLADAVKRGVAVVRASRTGSGIVTRNGEVRDDDYGFVAADNLSPQKARILLMLGLTVTRDPVKLQELFGKY
jgi:L-asparaginase